MKTQIKIYELQVDEKPMGYTVRLNDEKGCVLRICQIPKEIIEKGEMIDVIYNEKPEYRYQTIKETLNSKI